MLTVIIMLAISIVLYNRSKKKQVYDANAVNRKKTTKIKGDNEVNITVQIIIVLINFIIAIAM